MKYFKGLILKKEILFKGISRSFLICSLLMLSATSLHAANTAYSWERGVIRLGAIYSVFDSDLGVTISGVKGTQLNGEDLLGLEESQFDGRADAYLRFGDNLLHRLDFSYTGHHRSADERVNREVSIGGIVVLPENRVKSEFDLDIYRLLYSYSLIQDERISLGIGLGAYVFPVRYGIEIGRAREGGPDIDETIFPFPALFLRNDYLISPKLNFFSNFAAMFLEISGYDGTLIDFRIGFEYNLLEHLGFGLAYELLHLALDTNSEGEFLEIDLPGDFDFTRNGIMVYTKFYF